MRTAAAIQPAPGSFRELWRVAMPLVLSQGSLSLMHVVDRIFLTWYSLDAMAAAFPAGMLHWTIMSIAIGTVMYVNTFVAQYEGANRPDRVVASVWQGLYLSLFSGVLFLAVTPLAPSIFSLIGHAPTIQRLEVDYFSIFCIGAVPITLSAGLSCFYSGRGATQVVMWVNFAVAAVNGVLDYCLIFGVGPFPEMGIRGAALATVLANALAVVLYLLLMFRSQIARQYGFWKWRRFDPELFRRLLRFGLPTGLQLFTDIAGFTLFCFLVGAIGRQELAATTIAFNLNTLAFVPLFGFGTAVMTLVGKRIGEGRPDLAVRTTWLAYGLSAGYVLIFAMLYVLAPGALLKAYALHCADSSVDVVCDQVVMLIRFVALYSFFDAMAIVFGSAIRGAGDTRFSMIYTFLCGWLLMVLPTAIAHWQVGGSLMVSWIACTSYIVVLGVGLLLRFQCGHWKTMRVIETGGETGGGEEDSRTAQAATPVDALPLPQHRGQDIPLETGLRPIGAAEE